MASVAAARTRARVRAQHLRPHQRTRSLTPTTPARPDGPTPPADARVPGCYRTARCRRRRPLQLATAAALPRSGPVPRAPGRFGRARRRALLAVRACLRAPPSLPASPTSTPPSAPRTGLRPTAAAAFSLTLLRCACSRRPLEAPAAPALPAAPRLSQRTTAPRAPPAVFAAEVLAAPALASGGLGCERPHPCARARARYGLWATAQ
nr:atherin-like [Aegilops tauschii subsp. strangulata]